ncbi:MAG: NAD-dependent epimerase/dehydratase family protein [Polyangiales bacterium]
MERALVTGSTGLVGFHVVEALRRRGVPVRALVRDPVRARAILHAGVELVKGDVTAKETLAPAIGGCDVVFHAAGLPEQWLPDVGTFERVNVGGTSNLIDAALAAGVERFVYTSTIDVFRADEGESYDESSLDPEPKGTAYERSKQEADRRVVRAMEERGLPAVFVHPAAVYGPGPAGSPGLGHFVADLRDGKVPMLPPGGVPVVFAPDVGEGHVLAAEKGGIGERFILAEGFYPTRVLAEAASRALGLGKLPRAMPAWLAKVVSPVSEGVSRLFGGPPLLPKGQLHFMLWGARPDARRARERLGWKPTPLDEGMRALVRSLDG